MKRVSHMYYVRSSVFQSRCYFYLVLEDGISIVVRLFEFKCIGLLSFM